MENDDILAAFEQHHNVTADTIRELQSDLERIEARLNRGGGRAASGGVGEYERREAQAALATFIRTA
jgi:hypothetical protein